VAPPFSPSSPSSAPSALEASRDDQVDPSARFVAAAAQGNRAAMRSLLAAVAPVVIRAARRMLGAGHPDVEDVAQQALAAFAERLPAFRGESSVAHFAERIAIYRALTARRDDGVQRRIEEQAILERPDEDPDTLAPSPFASVAARAQRGLLLQALDTLAEAQAEALALHFLFDHTVAEIAGMTGAAEETVRSRLRLGKQTLRKNIEKDVRLHALREEVDGAGDGAAAPHSTARREQEP
jgi:RNA polymerase sigma-70 factor (ECF subfamily)